MKTKPLTFLLALTFLFLFSGSVYGQETEIKKDYWDKEKTQVSYETHYKNGKIIDQYFYNEYGRKLSLDHYENGELDFKISWDEENGRKVLERYYPIKGRRDGFETQWFETGEKNFTRRWKYGEKWQDAPKKIYLSTYDWMLKYYSD